MDNSKGFRSGFVAIVGRPNVGKSTLINALVGEKVAIVSSRPQTTRNRLMGIVCGEDYQMVFVDTPGIHTPRTRLGSYMMQAVQEGMEGIDALTVLVDVTSVGPNDRQIAADMAKKKVPVFLLLNKIDLVEPSELLRIIDIFKDMGFTAILPISAKEKNGLDELVSELLKVMPNGPKYFPDDMITDQPERLICAELIREKALLHLRDEVPHGIGVEILGIQKKSETLTEIHADIYCERDSHKAIIIGKRGAMLAQIGKEARIDIESLLGTPVNLQLWVKVRPDWRNSLSDLRTLGYDDRA
ncbi:MAG: GTPase Era [Clostridia bacterium]|nr:GTPase Era [Clostridia bacterium]